MLILIPPNQTVVYVFLIDISNGIIQANYREK